MTFPRNNSPIVEIFQLFFYFFVNVWSIAFNQLSRQNIQYRTQFSNLYFKKLILFRMNSKRRQVLIFFSHCFFLFSFSKDYLSLEIRVSPRLESCFSLEKFKNILESIRSRAYCFMSGKRKVNIDTVVYYRDLYVLLCKQRLLHGHVRIGGFFFFIMASTLCRRKIENIFLNLLRPQFFLKQYKSQSNAIL